MRSLGKGLVQHDWCPFKKRRLGHRYKQREDPVKMGGTGCHLVAKKEKPRRN